jgi:hypothetical protein
MNKPFSQACENNKQPIVEVLKRVFTQSKNILEIGSGTAQHAVHFAPNLPHLDWHTSDMPDNHSGMQSWLDEAEINNLHAPLAFTVGLNDWPLANIDGVYTANTTHIMQKSSAQLMMKLVADNLNKGDFFCQYGPFNVQGQYTSESNHVFDQHLHEQGCGGIRDIEELVSWAKPMELLEQVPMVFCA